MRAATLGTQRRLLRSILASASLLALGACNSEPSPEKKQVSAPLPGTLIEPADWLSPSEKLRFYTGRSFGVNPWVFAPASTTARDGLGPLFNARSCSACHVNGGRGRLPASEGEALVSSLFRISVPGKASEKVGVVPEPNYGTQLQLQGQGVGERAVPAEVVVHLNEEQVAGQYPDGTPYSLSRPLPQFSQWAYGEPAANMQVSLRTAPPLIGLALIDAIDEADLLDYEDPEDRDGDGISGRANRVWSVAQQQMVVGRFGHKASQPDLRQQTADAFNGDMGLTSSIFPAHRCTASQTACRQRPSGAGKTGVEVDDSLLDAVALFGGNLRLPTSAASTISSLTPGKALFAQLKCSACHRESIPSGSRSPIEADSISPYSDLLLHDMGEGLADHRPDFAASGREWRTAPLWGLRLSKHLHSDTGYLHDSRARTLEEAILWHGGEAQHSRQLFMQLPAPQRQQLIEFLRTL